MNSQASVAGYLSEQVSCHRYRFLHLDLRGLLTTGHGTVLLRYLGDRIDIIHAIDACNMLPINCGPLEVILSALLNINSLSDPDCSEGQSAL